MAPAGTGARFEDREELSDSIRRALDAVERAQVGSDGVRKAREELPWNEQLGKGWLEVGDTKFHPDLDVPPEISSRVRGGFGPGVGELGCLVGAVAGIVAAITALLLLLSEPARRSPAPRVAVLAGLVAVLGFWAMRRAHQAAREEERLAQRLPFRTGLYLLPDTLLVFRPTSGYLSVPLSAVTRVFVARFGSFDRTQLEYREPDGLRVEILGPEQLAPTVRAWFEGGQTARPR